MTPLAATPGTAPRALVAASAAFAVLLTAASCSDAPSPAPGPASSSNALVSPSASTEEVTARDKALAAFTGYREAQVQAYAKASIEGTGLTDYVGDPLLSEVRFSVAQLREQGLVGKGRPTWSPKVTKVDVTHRPFTVEIEDCFDHGSWDTVRKDNGKSVVAPGQATRYLVQSKAVQYDDGRFLIQESKAYRDRPC